MAEPYFRPLSSGSAVDSRAAQMHDAAEASRLATAEEAAFLRSLGKPRAAQSELPQLKEPVLSEDFAQRLAKLDEEILRRGIAVDKERLVSLGRERFEQLLAADRRVPRGSLGAGVEATRWQSVQASLHAFECAVVPRRTTLQQVSGDGKEREAVRQITGFDDLWKASHERQETLDDVLRFRDLFESLILGQSILERLSKDGRVRSRFMCGGKGRRVEYLRDWLGVLEGDLVSVRIAEPLFSLMAWLVNERTPAPSHIDLAREFFSVRSPSAAQIKLTAAVVDGFLLGFRDWEYWNHVGKATRSAVDESRLAAWRKQLAAHFPRVSSWHQELRTCFNREVDSHDIRHSHLQFDSTACRAFIGSNVQQLLDCASALLALGVNDVAPRAIMARFETQVLASTNIKLEDKRAQVSRQLQAAFPHSAFQLEFTEAQS